MKEVEKALLRLLAFVTYMTGVGGFAFALGSPVGWFVLAIGGAVPGGYLLAQSMNDRANVKVIKAGRGEVYTPLPPNGGNDLAPDPISLPPRTD